MKLKDIVHARAGDKGDWCNISIIPFDEAHYAYLKSYLTVDLVKQYYQELCLGEVTRYEIDSVASLNFVLDKTLDGGVTRSLAIDKHGKSLAFALLDLEIPTEWRFADNNKQERQC